MFMYHVRALYTILLDFDFKSGLDFFFRRRRALCLYTIINNNKIIKKCVLTFRTTGVHDSDERLLIRTAACVCYIYYIYIYYTTCIVFHVYIWNPVKDFRTLCGGGDGNVSTTVSPMKVFPKKKNTAIMLYNFYGLGGAVDFVIEC